MADSDSDVLVIGAGAAGLATASELRQHGLKVRILEARDRIGGRIYTLRPDGLPFPIELGAEFIHGAPPEIFDLLQKTGTRFFESNRNFWRHSGGKLSLDPNYYDKVEKIFALMCAERERVNLDESFSHFFKRVAKEDEALGDSLKATRQFIESYNAAVAELISVHFLARGEIAAQALGYENYSLLDGYDQLINQLSKNPFEATDCLHLKTVATKIAWRRGLVTVSTDSGLDENIETNIEINKSLSQTREFAASQVVVTVPIGVLKAKPPSLGAISFEPPLEKLKDLQSIQESHVRRLVLVFSDRFWEHNFETNEFFEFGIIHAEHCPITSWWCQFPIHAPFLVGWAGGPKAMALPTDKEAVERLSLESLSVIFGKTYAQLKDMLIGFYTNDWSSDPFARCAYSYHTIGAESALKALNEGSEDTIYFAGEAINPDGFSSTVHGALKSGYSAADKILASRGLL